MHLFTKVTFTKNSTLLTVVEEIESQIVHLWGFCNKTRNSFQERTLTIVSWLIIAHFPLSRKQYDDWKSYPQENQKYSFFDVHLTNTWRTLDEYFHIYNIYISIWYIYFFLYICKTIRRFFWKYFSMKNSILKYILTYTFTLSG